MATKNNPIESIEQTFIDPYGLAGQSTYDNQKGTWTDALTGKTGRASQPFGVGLTDQLEQMAKQNDAASRQALQSATSAANSAARDAQSAHTQALKALDSLTSTYENQINQEMRRRQQEAERVRKAQEKAQREAEAARVKAAKQVAKASSVRELPQDVLGRIPKFDPSGIQGWSRLTQPDRQRYYDAYAKSVADGIKSVNSNLDDADINSYISELNRDTRPVMQERSWGETLSDWGNLIAAGVDKVQQSAWYDLIDPSSDAAKANRAERQAHLNNLSYQTRSEMRENEIRSEEAKAAGDTGFWAWLQNVRNSPMAAITQDGAEAAAGIGLIGAGALGTLASGGTAAGAAIPAVAAGANILYGAASSAGGLRGDIYQRIHAADDAYLQSSSADYRELRKTMSENAAKDALGSRVTDHLPELVTAATVGAVMERFGLGRLGTADAVGAMATQGLRAAAGRVGREAASEGIEEGVQQAAANYGFRRYDPNQSLTEDVLLSAGVGATMGGGMAAGLNAGMAVANRGRPDTTSDAAVQQTAIGDIGFTEDAGDATPAAPVQEMSSQIIENADGTMTRVVRNETGAWDYDPQIPAEFNPRSPEADAFIAAQSATATANPQSDAAPAVDAPTAASADVETATPAVEVETAPAAEVVTPDSDVASSADSAVAALSSANRMAASQPATADVAAPAADTTVDTGVAAAISGLTETAARAVEASVRTEQAVAETAAEQAAELGRIAGLVRGLSLSDRQAIAASTDPAVVQSPVYQAIVQAGVESAMVEGNSWADSIFSGAAANPLEAVQSNATSAGLHNAEAARLIGRAFQQAGIPLPRFTLSGGLRQGVRGSYTPSTHTVKFNRGVTTANTVTHEYFHALTVPGIEVMQQAARNGDSDAITYLSSLAGIHSFLKSKADGRRYYGNASPAEMMAEIVRPEFMNYAQQLTIDDAVSEGFVTEREVAFMREYSTQGGNRNLVNYIRTLAQMAVRAAQAMLGQTGRGADVDMTVAGAIAELSAIAAAAGGRTTGSAQAQQAATLSEQQPATSSETTAATGAQPIIDIDAMVEEEHAASGNYRDISPLRSNMSELLLDLANRLYEAEARLPNSLDLAHLDSWGGDNRRVLPESASSHAKLAKFHAMFEEALRSIVRRYEGATVKIEVGHDGSLAFIITSPVRPDPQTFRITPITVRGRTAVRWNTMGFSRLPRGMGGQIYDAFNGALIGSGLTPANGMLSAINAARLPINRLRAAMKWGNYFTDARGDRPYGVYKAAKQMRLAGRGSNMHGVYFNRDPDRVGNYLVNLASIVVNQAEANGTLRGKNVMNPDGTITLQSGRTLTAQQFDEATSYVYATDPRYDRALRAGGSSTNYAKKLAAIIRGLEAVRGNDRATRQLIDSVVKQETALFDADSSTESGLSALLPFNEDADPNEQSVEQIYFEEDLRYTRPHVNESGSFDSVTDPIADDVIPDASTQRDAVEFINDVEAGRSVASSYWRTTAGDAIRQGTAEQATKKLVRDLVSKADEVFADSIRPFRNWVNIIADAGHIGEREVNRIMGSLYRASSYRDALLRRMRDEWGLEQVEEVINDIANKSKISRATAIEWAGMWISATYAPEATMHILNRNARENARRQSEADALQERLDGMTQGDPEYAAVETELRNLQREIKDVAEDMRKMLAAANDPTVRRKALHEVGGGMNFATAAKIRQVIENKIDVEQLRKLHEPMRKMMAYRLAMDVESGKTTVSKMVEFTGKPELRALGNALVAASQAADSKVDGAMQRLDDVRDAFAAAAESNYVPLTGNPEHAMSVELFGMDNFGQQSRAPNGGRNFRMEGRKELPDSAVKAAMSAAISSATFAGYKSFGDQIAKLHNSLSPAQRDQFGLHASALREDQTYPANSIIVRRNGRTTAYHLTDATAFEALRKGNLEMQRNALGEMIGGVTKKMAWLMTQGNPYFIARQIIQDGWERGTTLMGKELYDKDGNKIDSTAVSRHMRNLLINPFSLAKLANAALSVAFNRNKLMSRVFQADPYTANMIKELLNEGGISTRASMFAYSSADMERSMQRNRKTAANIAKLAVTDFMESANNAVEYTTALAAYMAMREFGMSKADAIDTQLDLSNFRKKGTANAAFAPLWAFAQPAFMGGSNLISSAFDRKGNPKAKTFKYLASRIVIMLIIQSIARALADDNEGGDTIDQMNHYTLASRLPIPLGNGATFDVPLGFGLARVANSAARGVLNIGTGEGSVRDLAAGVMADGIISGISPIQPSEIDPQKRPAEWALATFMPTIFKPITEVAVNRNSFDGRIVNNANPKKDQYNWQQYGGNTSEFWRDIAKAVHSATGIDLAPEQTRHLVRGYLPGVPSSMMREFVDRPYAQSIGRDAGNSFFEPFNRLNAEAAINGQFNKMNEEIEDLLKVRAADPAAFHADSEQAQLIAAYESWKKRNDALAGRMRSITRSPMSEEAKKQARANVGEQRTEESRRMLAEYRRIKGLEYSQTK